MAAMMTTKNNFGKSFKFLDPLDNIVEGKKQKQRGASNHLYQSY